MAIDWFTRLFTISYKLPAPCAGCEAHKQHIEDLQNLLKSERESYAGLQQVLLMRYFPQPPSQAQDLSPVGGLKSTAQRRQAALDREKSQSPDARHDYWRNVQDAYDKAGKLPEKKHEPDTVTTGSNSQRG